MTSLQLFIVRKYSAGFRVLGIPSWQADAPSSSLITFESLIAVNYVAAALNFVGVPSLTDRHKSEKHCNSMVLSEGDGFYWIDSALDIVHSGREEQGWPSM